MGRGFTGTRLPWNEASLDLNRRPVVEVVHSLKRTVGKRIVIGSLRLNNVVKFEEVRLKMIIFIISKGALLHPTV